MRAMILAAGLGTRMRPLSALMAKPALPVLGRPVIAYLLELIAHHGVEEVMINLHYASQSVRDAVEQYAPRGLRIEYSQEDEPLGTGGGIARAADFLRQSGTSLVMAGDMLLDLDLGDLMQHHRASEALCTLALLDDPARSDWPTIGIDDAGRVRRIASRFDLGGETSAGLFTGVRLFSPACFELIPTALAGPPTLPFEDLSDWLAPALAAGHSGIRGTMLTPEACVFLPVGTPAEYLAANLDPPVLSFLPREAMAAPGTRISPDPDNVVLGPGARLGEDAKLQRAVVFADEEVPDGFRASTGVFAGGRFYDCGDSPQPGASALDSVAGAPEE